MTTPAKPELDVEVQVENLAGGQVELAVRVPPTPVAAVREQVIKALSRHVNLPGFRKGKAPRAMVERALDQDVVKEQIIDHLLSDAYDAALEKAEIKPLDRARIADADLAADGALTFKATVTLRPEITLGEYKGLAATRRISLVTEQHIDVELERLRARRAQYQGLPSEDTVQQGDLVIVDYDMLVDGEKRDDASASGYPLEIGADQLFPELNEALVGAKPGDLREFTITYPENHSDQSVAGKTATFQVTVREARRRQLPALDDEFARQVSDLDSLEALRARVRGNLERIGGALADQEVREQLVRQVLDAATLTVPEAVVNRETERRIEETRQELARRGLSLAQHLQQIDRSQEDWRADIEAEARQAARRALVLDEIGDREEIQVSEQEIQDEIHVRAEAEAVDEATLRERLSDSAEFNHLLTRIYHRKIVEFLVDNGQVTEETVEPGPAPEGAEGEAADQPAPEPPDSAGT